MTSRFFRVLFHKSYNLLKAIESIIQSNYATVSSPLFLEWEFSLSHTFLQETDRIADQLHYVNNFAIIIDCGGAVDDSTHKKSPVFYSLSH